MNRRVFVMGEMRRRGAHVVRLKTLCQLLFLITTWVKFHLGSRHAKMCLWAYMYSGQRGHPFSLIRAFAFAVF